MLVGEGDEVQVHRVEHQLDRHQHGDHVLAGSDPEDADGEEQEAHHQVVRRRHREHGNPFYCRRPSTTAPIIATSRKTEAISKGSRAWVKRLQATAWELPTAAPWTVLNVSGWTKAGPKAMCTKK